VFEEEIDIWSKKVNECGINIELWIKLQLNYMYLQPIFDSGDIVKQLPSETKMFRNVDNTWKTTITQSRASNDIINFCTQEDLNEKLKLAIDLLERVTKGLED